MSQNRPIRLSYLICATPRSGSNFLCETLRSTGGAGRPDEYFWNRPYWHERSGVTGFPSFFRRLQHEGTGTNGVFGSKLMRDQATVLVPELAALLVRPEADPPEVLGAAFPNLRYIWLRRLDKIRQGISFYRALRTGCWRSTDLAGVPLVDPPFDFEAIQGLVQLSVWEDEDWDDFFRPYAIEPLVVTYEDLAVAPEAVVRRIIDHLGVRPPARLRPEVWRHQRQADALTDAWVAQYEACDRARRTSSIRHAGSG